MYAIRSYYGIKFYINFYIKQILPVKDTRKTIVKSYNDLIVWEHFSYCPVKQNITTKYILKVRIS